MSTATEKQFSRRLGKVLKGLPAPLSTGGTATVREQPAIALKGSDETFVVRPAPEEEGGDRGERRERRMQRQVDALKDLTERIPAAAFGHGKETKRDPSVRNAKQLPAAEFETNLDKEVLDDISRQIQNDLALETDIVLEPYSLNIYEKGGHFVKHKDTPRDSQIGTLVICLPSLFEGGVLDVSTGTDKYFDPFFDEFWPDRMAHLGMFWGRDCGGKWGLEKDGAVEFNPKCIAWSAFFADTEHMIDEVTGGVRVTLAYSIRRKDPSDESGRPTGKLGLGEQCSIIEHEIQKAFDAEGFLTNGGRIGCPCFHLYINTDEFVDQSRANPLTPGQIKKLKGKDLMIANAAASLGMKVYLAPYLSMDKDAQGDISDLPLNKMPDKKVSCPGCMSQGDVENFFDGDYGGKHCMSLEAMPFNHADVWTLEHSDETQKKHIIGSTDYSYDGYFGNEAYDTAFYVSCVLFIEVPAYTERIRQRAQNN